MFLDASVIVAILKTEPEAAGFLAAIDAARGKVFTSAIARYEAVISLSVQIARVRGEPHMTNDDHGAAEELVSGFLEEIGARDIPMTESIGQIARVAAKAFGKVAGHPAKLNMGDCFAYATANAYRITLLSKGHDLARIDMGYASAGMR